MSDNNYDDNTSGSVAKDDNNASNNSNHVNHESDVDEAGINASGINKAGINEVGLDEVSSNADSESSSGEDNAVTEIVGKAKQGLSMIEQLLDDMEDDEFWSLPAGEWEKKNNRDENGLPL